MEQIRRIIRRFTGLCPSLGAQGSALESSLVESDSSSRPMESLVAMSRSLSRPAEKADTSKIIKAIGLLDAVDNDLSEFTKSLQIFYGYHFPELAHIVSDNILYAKVVKLMRNRANAATLDFTEVLPEEIETRVKAAAVISNGCELKEPDFQHIDGLCDLVLSLNYTRAQLFDDMRIKLNTVAPNLTALVGELVAARLIAKGGGMLNLAKQPAGTARASLISKAYSRKVRRKMARSLGAKIALAIRCDALGDTQDSTMGLETRAKLEARLRDLEAIELARSAQVGFTSNTQTPKPTAAVW